ncbi:hypothetical protein [Streptomyces sp. NPDC002520]
MRSARILLATAAATAALAFAVPGAALAGDDGGRDNSSHSSDSGSGRDNGSGSGRDNGSGSGRDNGSGSGRGNSSGDDSDDDYSSGRGGDNGDRPRGGMHTGGGALAAVRSDQWTSSGEDDSRFDPETYKDNGDSGDDSGDDSGEDSGDNGGKGNSGKGSGSGRDNEDSGSGGRDKPRGGMHTGGGALADPGVSTGGMAVLAVGATGMYALRRKKAGEQAS